jgi:hypothetical protein
MVFGPLRLRGLEHSLVVQFTMVCGHYISSSFNIFGLDERFVGVDMLVVFVLNS